MEINFNVSSCNKTIAWLLLILFFLMILNDGVYAQQQSSSECMNRLLPCSDYINNDRDPPDRCCDPLKYVIENEPECLCSMMSVQGASRAERAGVNLTKAQTLPARCGRHINPLGCVVGTPTGDSSRSTTSKATLVVYASIFVGIVFLLT